jgi:hypothetical protein
MDPFPPYNPIGQPPQISPFSLFHFHSIFYGRKLALADGKITDNGNENNWPGKGGEMHILHIYPMLIAQSSIQPFIIHIVIF